MKKRIIIILCIIILLLNNCSNIHIHKFRFYIYPEPNNCHEMFNPLK